MRVALARAHEAEDAEERAKLQLKLAQEAQALLSASLLMWTGARRSTIRQLRVNQDKHQSQKKVHAEVKKGLS